MSEEFVENAPEVVKMEEQFSKLEESDSKSLLKECLTRQIFEDLKKKKTIYGSTLLDCIQSGLQNLDSGVGVYAADPNAYTAFAPLFDAIIRKYHDLPNNGTEISHPPQFWGNSDDFGNVDETEKYVISTRIRIGRSLDGFAFNPCLTETNYTEIDKKVEEALLDAGNLELNRYSLEGMSDETKKQLIDDHFLFKEGDRFLQAANACRFWPRGRAIYHNPEKTLLVWVNEEDHMRIISMQKGGDVKEIYDRLTNALKEMEKKLDFSHDERLGFLTFCPTNLGTTVRASVLIRIPKLLANEEELEAIAKEFKLQVRGTRGEHSAAEGGIVDVSNKRRMGLTEHEAVLDMYNGVRAIIEKEKALENDA